MRPLFEELDEVSQRLVIYALLAMRKEKLEKEYDELERSKRAARSESSHPQTKAPESMAPLSR